MEGNSWHAPVLPVERGKDLSSQPYKFTTQNVALSLFRLNNALAFQVSSVLENIDWRKLNGELNAIIRFDHTLFWVNGERPVISLDPAVGTSVSQPSRAAEEIRNLTFGFFRLLSTY